MKDLLVWIIVILTVLLIFGAIDAVLLYGIIWAFGLNLAVTVKTVLGVIFIQLLIAISNVK
jgi:low affinity Fe/Cu permease